MRHIGKSYYIRELKKRSKSLGNGLYEVGGYRFLDASEALKPHELRGMALTHMVHDEWLLTPKPRISLRKIRRQRKLIRLRKKLSLTASDPLTCFAENYYRRFHETAIKEQMRSRICRPDQVAPIGYISTAHIELHVIASLLAKKPNKD